MGKSKDLATGAAYQDQTESDTRYVNAAGDTMTGHLGVGGDAVPSASNYNNAVIHARQAGSSSVGSQLRLTTGATGHAAGDGSFISQWADSGLYITNQEAAHIAFSTGGSERVRIDSAGHMTMPHQPAFRAYLSTEWTTTGAYVSSGWTETYDRNNDFNQGTFTAPVAGVYHFTVNWDANASQSTLHMYHNGNYTYRREPTGRTDDNWESYTYSLDVKMAANDYVKLYLQAGSGNNPIHMGGGYWGNFCGHLIG